MAAMMAVFLLLSGWELFWRQQGFEPTVSDDEQIWGLARRRATRIDPKGVVLVGSSRIQLGLNPDLFQQVTAIRPVMLAIDGSSPLPVLQHLAEDVRFDSRVILSLLPMFLAEPAEEDRAHEWVAEVEGQKWSTRIETVLALFFQQHLAFRNPTLALDEIWSDLVENQWPRPPYAPMRADRYRPGYFERADLERLRKGRIERTMEIHAAITPLNRQAFMVRVRRIAALIHQIEQRGGAVALVRFPSSGTVLQFEQRDWPRRRYWDVLAQHLTGPVIHFEDYPSLSGYSLPDFSHLDVEDSKRFTRHLLQILLQKGFLSPEEVTFDR